MTQANPEELIAMLASIPDRLEAALAAGAGDAREGIGDEGWTVGELVGHLCDSARVWGGRMRLTAHEDRPALEPYDQDTYVRLAAYRYIPAAELAPVVRGLSVSNVAMLRGLAPEQWERVGVHSERGPLTLLQIVEIEANHEREHVEQIERLARV